MRMSETLNRPIVEVTTVQLHKDSFKSLSQLKKLQVMLGFNNQCKRIIHLMVQKIADGTATIYVKVSKILGPILPNF